VACQYRMYKSKIGSYQYELNSEMKDPEDVQFIFGGRRIRVRFREGPRYIYQVVSEYG